MIRNQRLTKADGPGGCFSPGNVKDFTRFYSLSQPMREMVQTRAAVLYDGSRTVARCYKEALTEAEKGK